MRKPHWIDVSLQLRNGATDVIGCILWPNAYRKVEIVNSDDDELYLVNVYDRNGVNSFSLDDIYLEDIVRNKVDREMNP